MNKKTGFIGITAIALVLLVAFVGIGMNVFAPQQESNPQNQRDYAVIHSFNATAISSNQVRLEWDVETNNPNLTLSISRQLIDSSVEIVILPVTVSEYIDTTNLYWGTEYTYQLQVVYTNGTTLASSDSLRIVTPIDANDPGSPKFSWNDYKARKYAYHPDDYLSYNSSFIIYSYFLHGVNVTVALSNSLFEVDTDSQLSRVNYASENFRNHVFNFFHRHWTTFRVFPVNEYRVVVYGEEKPVLGEDELGLRYGPDMFMSWVPYGAPQDGKLSHEIGHAWIGVGILRVEHEYDGNFDPQTQDSDKWIKEGFDQFYGIVHLDYEQTEYWLKYDLNRYKNEILGNDLDMPLVDMSIRFGTETMWTYYVKGGLVAYLINKNLIESDNKTLSEFLRWIYPKYNITDDNESIPEKLISTEELMNDLNTYSSYNFTSFFQDYVYGVRELPIDSIEMQYIDALKVY